MIEEPLVQNLGANLQHILNARLFSSQNLASCLGGKYLIISSHTFSLFSHNI